MSPRRPHSSTHSHRDGIHIRRAIREDAQGIATIYNHYVDLGGATFDTAHWRAKQITGLIQLTEPDGWFVATQSDRLLGWASARRYSQRDGYRHTCETAIYLEADAFGSGVADDLQRRLDDHCCQCRIHHAVAKIVAGNHRSIAFHQRHGYAMVGIQKEIGHMNGHWIDVAILQKLY